ncbi:MAG: hypothetical protein GY719_34580 [bacterium]|nr:hypothetical protein [bacterium]
MSENPGITFSETMAGGFALGETDPKAGKKKGEQIGSEMAMHATVIIDDLDRFTSEPGHQGSIAGSIDLTPFGEGMHGTGPGAFSLFYPEDSNLKLMVYELAIEHDGKPYYVAGKKEVSDDGGLDLWRDTTTLFTQLHEGTDKSGPVIGAGVLRIGVKGIIELVRALRVTGTESKTEQAKTVTKFGQFFLGELWDTYVKHT